MEEKKKVEKKVELPARSLKTYIILSIFFGMFLGAALAVLYYHANYGVGAFQCDLLVLTPYGAELPDANVFLCYQEVPGLQYYVALCPTSQGISFGSAPELNSELVWQFYQTCEELRAPRAYYVWKDGNGEEVNVP